MAIDQGTRLGKLFFDRLEAMLLDDETPLKAADMEMIRKVLSDNSITLASVQRGDFGQVVKEAAEQFPFGDDDAASREYASPLN